MLTEARPTTRTMPDPLTAAQVREAVTLMALLSDVTRATVLDLLRGGERNVTEMCEILEKLQPTLSHYLALLRISGLIWSRRVGKCNYYSLTPAGLAAHKVVVAAAGEGGKGNG
jgi:ArsR family transcriptional regulator